MPTNSWSWSEKARSRGKVEFYISLQSRQRFGLTQTFLKTEYKLLSMGGPGSVTSCNLHSGVVLSSVGVREWATRTYPRHESKEGDLVSVDGNGAQLPHNRLRSGVVRNHRSEEK